MPSPLADVIIGSVPPSRVHRAQTSLLDDMALHGLADILRKAAGTKPCPLESGRVGYLADHECAHMHLPTDPNITCKCWSGYTRSTP